MFNRLQKQKRNLYSKAEETATIDKKSIDKLWAKSSEFDTAWKQRISFMSNYITVPGAVADFGCGMMWLEECLKPENTYIPIDYMARDSRTIVIDLNCDMLPELGAKIAFMSGVLEYVKQPEKVIDNLAEQNVEQLIISYCTFDKFNNMDQRESLNWKSHLSIFELLGQFTKRYSLQTLDDINSNSIFVFSKK
jgi:hypothetical protein